MLRQLTVEDVFPLSAIRSLSLRRMSQQKDNLLSEVERFLFVLTSFREERDEDYVAL
jgi:hypothetical protein